MRSWPGSWTACGTRCRRQSPRSQSSSSGRRLRCSPHVAGVLFPRRLVLAVCSLKTRCSATRKPVTGVVFRYWRERPADARRKAGPEAPESDSEGTNGQDRAAREEDACDVATEMEMWRRESGGCQPGEEETSIGEREPGQHGADPCEKFENVWVGGRDGPEVWHVVTCNGSAHPHSPRQDVRSSSRRRVGSAGECDETDVCRDDGAEDTGSANDVVDAAASQQLHLNGHMGALRCEEERVEDGEAEEPDAEASVAEASRRLEMDETWAETVVCTVTPRGLARAVQRETRRQREEWAQRVVALIAQMRLRRKKAQVKLLEHQKLRTRNPCCPRVGSRESLAAHAWAAAKPPLPTLGQREKPRSRAHQTARRL